MIKSLITKQFAGDFFNMGGVPTFEREQIRNALASAIQMVSTSESPSGKGEEERAAQAEAANGCFTGAAQNTNLPKPNETLVRILKTTGGGTNKINNNSYDGLIIAVGHEKFKNMGKSKILKLCKENRVIFDLKYLFSKEKFDLRL